MNKFLIAICVALVATAKASSYSAGNGYQQQAEAGEYQLQGADSPGSASAIASAAEGAAGYGAAGGYGGYGSSQNIPYQPANTRGNTLSSSFSYPNNKGEILIHRPAAIIVKRPPTKVVVNHPPLVVKPAPVVLHKPPAVIVRKVFVKHHPRPVKVEPVYVNVVKPPAEKYFVKEKEQHSHRPGFAPVSVSAGEGSAAGYGPASIENAAANDGYQLLQNNPRLASLAKLSGSGGYSHG